MWFAFPAWIKWPCTGSHSSLMPARDTKQLSIRGKYPSWTIPTNNQCKLLLSHTKQDSVNAKMEVNHEEIRKEVSVFIKSSLELPEHKKTLKSNRHLIFKKSHVRGQLILGPQTQIMTSLDLTHIFPSLCAACWVSLWFYSYVSHN